MKTIEKLWKFTVDSDQWSVKSRLGRFAWEQLLASRKQSLLLRGQSLVGIVAILLLTAYCSLITPVYAVGSPPQIGIRQPSTNAGPQIGNATAPELLTRTLGNAIGLIFTFSAIAFVFYFFWGVIDWIMASGEKENIAKARNKITQAIVGMIILSLSFVIFAVVGQITGINLGGDITLPTFMNQNK